MKTREESAARRTACTGQAGQQVSSPVFSDVWILATGGGESEAAEAVVTLFLAFFAARVMAEIFERIGQPVVVGELFAGIIIGPSILGWVDPSNEVFTALAELGVIFLLFSSGLESEPRSMFRVGKTAIAVGAVGAFIPMALGIGVWQLFGGEWVGMAAHDPGASTWNESMFVGAAMVATSVGITAKVLADMGVLHATFSRIILGAAVIDDILGLMVLAVVTSLSEGAFNMLDLGLTAGLALGFVVVVIAAGLRLVQRAKNKIGLLRMRQPFFSIAIIVCLGLSVLAAEVKMAAIVGAFLAGMILSTTKHEWELEVRTAAVTDLFAPLFLVHVGSMLRLEALADPAVAITAGVVTVLAILGKVIGCGGAALGKGKRMAAIIGFGMMPRGEVGMIVAQIGKQHNMLSDQAYSVLVVMAALTTLMAPPILVRLVGDPKKLPDLSP